MKILAISFIFLLLVSLSSYAWWDGNWLYRQEVSINNTQNSNNLTDFQVAVNLTYNSKMQPDFSDIRFTWYNSSDGSEIQIPYWIEDKVNSQWAYIWIKVPFISANSYEKIYVYYGNLSYVNFDGIYSGINPKLTTPYGLYDTGAFVFSFYENFNGTSLNTSKWTTIGSGGTLTINNSLNITGSCCIELRSLNIFNSSILEGYGFATKQSQTYAWADFFGWRSSTSSSTNSWFTLYNNNYYSYGRQSSGSYYTSSTNIFAGTYQIFGILNDGSIASYYINYTRQPTTYNMYSPTNNITIRNGGSDTVFLHWVRVRKYSLVEPSLSFKQIQNKYFNIDIYSPEEKIYTFNWNQENKIPINFTIYGKSAIYDIKIYENNNLIYLNETYENNTNIIFYREYNLSSYNLTIFVNDSTNNFQFYKSILFTVKDLKYFLYRKEVFIDNTQNSNNLTDFQVAVNLTYNSKMQPDFSDIRFTWYNSSDGSEIQIPYWIEDKVNSQWAYIWIKVPFISANSYEKIYVYYGNLTPVSNESNGDAVFEFFDDFDDGIYNTTKWSTPVQGPGTYNESNGVLNLTVTGNTAPYRALSKTYTCQNCTIEQKVKYVYTTATPHLMIYFRQSVSGSNSEFTLRGGSLNDFYFYDGSYRNQTTLVSSLTINKWYFMQVKANGAFVYGYYYRYDNGENKYITSNNFGVTQSGYVGPGVWSAITTLFVDWFRVRKYSPVEPSISFGKEEISSTFYWIKTYDLNNNPESYFFTNQTIKIKAKINSVQTPLITITNESEDIFVNSENMISENGIDIWNYSFNTSISGWYNLIISSGGVNKTIKYLFYVSDPWQSETKDSYGNNFPFRIQVNISEINGYERIFEPIDININFNYLADKDSIRVAYYNGSSYLTVPHEIYNLTLNNNYVSNANLIWQITIPNNTNKTFYIYYSRAPLQFEFNTDLFYNSSSNTIENSLYKIFLNFSRGGAIDNIYQKLNNRFLKSNLEFIQKSPWIMTPSSVYQISNINPGTNNSSLINTSFFIFYNTYGETDISRFNLTYTFYPHINYFILETNTSSKATTNWEIYRDQYLFLNKMFNFISYRNSSGNIINTSISSISNLYNLSWVSIYDSNNISFGIIFLNDIKTKICDPVYDFVNDLNYLIISKKDCSSSLSVTPSDYFYSKVAIIPHATSIEEVDNIYNILTNPVLKSIGVSETFDTAPPKYSNISYNATNDTSDAICSSYWTDNLQFDYAMIIVNSSAYNNITTYKISGIYNESWINYTISSDLLEAGQISCNITVFDIAGNSNSTIITFNVNDATPPYFSNITNFPNNQADIDPNSEIEVIVNFTEYTDIDKAILQYRNLFGEWQNITMIRDSNTTFNFIYKAKFTPISEGIWQYRIFSSDTLGNTNISDIINVSVFWDYTWEITPETFGISSGQFNTNITLGILNITNTGDFPLSFKIISNWENKNELFINNTTEGDSGFEFYLENKTSELFEIKLTAKTVERIDNLNINIYALNSSATPQNKTINATIISYAGGPFLYVTILQYNLSVTQGDSNIELKARVQNKGNETATNVWLAWVLPERWAISFGYQNITSYYLNVNDILESNILVSIAENAPTGIKTLYAISGCEENKTGVASVQVVVNPKPTNQTIEIPGPSGPPPSGPAQALSPTQKQKIFQTEEIYHITRGKEKNFTLKVENPFSYPLSIDSIKISGLLAQYLDIIPKTALINTNDYKNFTILITAPAY
ncbi:MAG: DUF2341 domain-containing protein, partial [Candidatus Aenigmatarchaeota archaeon]